MLLKCVHVFKCALCTSVFGQSQAELVRSEPKSSADEPTTRFYQPSSGHEYTVDRTTLKPVPVPDLGQTPSE